MVLVKYVNSIQHVQLVNTVDTNYNVHNYVCLQTILYLHTVYLATYVITIYDRSG